MSERLVIYVAGPYTGEGMVQIGRNVLDAAEAGQEIMRRGHVPLVPHTMTHHWDIGTGLGYQQFIAADLELLRRCDAICMVGTWEQSAGARGELRLAEDIGLEVFECVADVPDLRLGLAGRKTLEEEKRGR